MKEKGTFKRIFAILMVALILSVSFSYTFWKNEITGSVIARLLFFQTGEYDFNEEESWLGLDEIEFIPDSIKEKILGWVDVKDPAVINSIINTVVSIYEYSHFEERDNQLHIESSIEDLFADGALNVSENDFIIYVTGTGENMVTVVIHIGQNDFTFESPQHLLDSLNNLWNTDSGVLSASPLWTRGTYYTWRHAPIEYNGELFYFQNNNNRELPPPQSPSTWFAIKEDFAFVQSNVYPIGYIVRHQNGQYYRAAQGRAWNTALPGWPWVEVNEWTAGTYSEGWNAARNMVFTIEEGKPRFWEVLRQTSHAPSEQSCTTGDWREVKNAWMSDSNSAARQNYLEHNIYFENEIVVFGVSANMQYRFYRAVRDVPSQTPPLVRMPNGQLELNSHYWERA